MPIVKDVQTTKKHIMNVFKTLRQNSSFTQAPSYPAAVNALPYSAVVLSPVNAKVQSAIEKKSSSTLKLPHKVQMNGKADMINQKIANTYIEIRNLADLFSVAALIYFFSLKSLQVRLRTGSKSIVTPIIVSTEVAEADESCLVSPPKSLKINQLRLVA